MAKRGRPRTFWIPVEAGVHDRSKTIDLAARLGLTPDATVGLLTRLWLWNLQERSTGDVTNLQPMMLAHAARWNGDAEKFVDDLRESEWIRTKRGREYLSGWKRMVEPYLRELARKREDYQRFKRKKLSGKTTGKQPPVGAPPVRIPHPTNTNTEEKKKTQRAKRAPDPTARAIAGKLLTAYETLTGHKRAAPTERLLIKQLERDPALADRMATAQSNYAIQLEANPPSEKRFIITTRNWFGREQRWTEKEAIEPVSPKRGERKPSHLNDIDHSPTPEDEDRWEHKEFCDGEIERLWTALDPADQSARIEKATAKIKSMPQGKRMVAIEVERTAIVAAKESMSGQLPTFNEWKEMRVRTR